MSNTKKDSAVRAARATLMPLQKSFDEGYKVLLMAVEALGFSKEEAVDIAQEAIQLNAEILKDKQIALSDESKNDLAFAEQLGKLI